MFKKRLTSFLFKGKNCRLTPIVKTLTQCSGLTGFKYKIPGKNIKNSYVLPVKIKVFVLFYRDFE